MATPITTELIKNLRDATGVSVMQCKKALEEAEGDMEKALLILKKKSSDIALKKADRTAADGIVIIKTTTDKAVALVLNCETDFVAKNDDFTKLAEDISNMAMEKGKDATTTESAGMISSAIQKLGENIQIGTLEVTDAAGTTLGSYVHNGKSGTLVMLKGGNAEIAKDIAMHVTAMKPEYTNMSDVPADMTEKVKGMFEKDVNASDKPEEIKAKMLAGKIDGYLKELVLTEQPFFKTPDMTVGKMVANAGAEIVRFVRYTI
jgi:elongation factor Ts